MVVVVIVIVVVVSGNSGGGGALLGDDKRLSSWLCGGENGRGCSGSCRCWHHCLAGCRGGGSSHRHPLSKHL